MKTPAAKPLSYRILRRVPMPVLAILVGLLAGLAVWGALDQVQGRAIEKITTQELRTQLEFRARESLNRFDQYMTSYDHLVRLLANHRRLAEYLEPQFWFPGAPEQPVVYDQFRPYWLPDLVGRRGLPSPSHVLLVDTRGQVREMYRSVPQSLPQELASGIPPQFQAGEEVRSVLTRFDDQPYLLASGPAEDTSGYRMGSLVVLVPINDAFLAASQTGLPYERAAVALVDADEERILASIDPGVILPGTQIADWQDTYLVTSQSLPAYEGSDWNVLFATFVSHESVDKVSRRVGLFVRRQRGIAAVAMITVFTLVIYLVSARLNKVLKRMSRFAQRALGIGDPGFRRGGNQLLLLEEWIQHFTQLVLRARDEMRRQHESEMRESEALKAAMMEASLDSIVTIDGDGRIIEFNPTAEGALGLDRHAVLGRRFSELFIGPSARASFLTLLQGSQRAVGEGREGHARGELTARRADGTEFPVELSIVPINLEAELFYTLYMHDVTKRKEAERQIKSLARFAGESPNPILRVTPDGTLAYANPASATLLSAWGPPGRLPPEWLPDVNEALAEGQAREREAEVGGQLYAFLFAPVPDLGYVNIYARDITAVRRAEQEARQHQAELVHVCRLSTMGEVATGMAHEINQPLSAIVNFANGASRRLQGGVGERHELVDAMAQIASQAQRAGEIIRRLRALVGKQPPVRSRVDLNHLVREVCSFVEFDTARLEVRVELDLAPGEVLVDVDLVQIEQVLLNLVRNAMDALEEVPAGTRRLRIRTWADARGAAVSVEDSGPGIPPARMQHLFDAFYTTKAAGMGMGLPISQTILENHGGTIRAESPPGGGAVFQLRLPLAGTVEAAEHATAGMT